MNVGDNMVNWYRTRKQKDLEDDLEGMVKKNTDLMRVNAKLKSDLMQKETLVNAQGEEVFLFLTQLEYILLLFVFC